MESKSQLSLPGETAETGQNGAGTGAQYVESMSQLSLPGETAETGDVVVLPLEELLAPARTIALTYLVLLAGAQPQG